MLHFESFRKDYNSGSYRQIFNRFSEEMKSALPIDDARTFFENLKSDAGKILSGELLESDEEGYHVYKTSFEFAVLSVSIAVDEYNKICGLNIVPFEEIDNTLTGLPEKISELIYNHTNIFPEKTELSIAVIQNGSVEYCGVRIENGKLITINNSNKIFEIGSISKVFTSTILAGLLLEKTINPDDLINDYYPFDFNNNIQISFLELANHSSGLPRLPENFDDTDVVNPYKNYGEIELNDYLANMLERNPETYLKYDYSNLGAGLLGHTLGLTQNQSFRKLLKERIFIKYNMLHTCSGFENVEKKLVPGLDEEGNEIPNWEFDVLLGGGGILSNAEDLVKFAKAHFDLKNTELILTGKATLDVDHDMKIGLGWHILQSDGKFNLLWHNGATGGYSSSMVIDKEKKNAVIILSNVSAYHPNMENIDNLCFELLAEIENQA